MATLTPKLSVGRVVGEIGKIKEKIAVCQFNGVARGYERGESTIGKEVKPWIRFRGVFSATNLATGETYGPSPVLFLPDHAANMLAAAVDLAGHVRIALEIIAIPCDTPIGYRYDVSTLPGDKLIETAMHMLSQADNQAPEALPSPADLA